jgi:hypothetical protein
MRARYLEWDNIGLCGIAGISGSGKSSTMRFLLAQMALGGTGIFLADGHGKIGVDNLAHTTTPLASAFLAPVATDVDAAVDLIHAAAIVAHNRRNGKDKDIHFRVAIVIDEYISIMRQLDEDRRAEIVEIMETFATDYRKTNVKMFVAAQNWKEDFIGSAAIRQSMNATVLHRVSPDDVRLFQIPTSLKREVTQLRVGHAFILQQVSDPVKVYVPKITQDDLRAIAHLVPQVELSEPKAVYSAPESVNSGFFMSAG